MTQRPLRPHQNLTGNQRLHHHLEHTRPMTRCRPQRSFRIAAVLLSALVVLASACGSTENAESNSTANAESIPTTTARTTTTVSTTTQPAPILPSAVDCSVGMILSEGESCVFGVGSEFSVEPGGRGCFVDGFCIASGSSFGELSLRKIDDDTWTIVSSELPP